MRRAKQFFLGWNLFEKNYFVAVLILPIVLSIIFKSTAFECLAVILNLVWALLVAKGKSFAHIIGLPATLCYAYVAYNVAYYGEVVITFCVMLPLIFISLFAWLKNKTTDANVVVANPNKTEMLVAASSQMILGFVYYFVLRSFATEFLLVSTFSIMTNVFATYLTMRRNQYSFLAYIVNDIALIVLWGYLVFSDSLGYISMLLLPVMLLVNDFYGTLNWARLRKTQIKSTQLSEVKK